MAYADEVAADVPLIYWRLGEPSGATAVADSSGNGRGGATQFSPTFGQAGALVGDANTAVRCFNGGHIYSDSPTPDFFADSTWSVECWVKGDSVPGGTRRRIMERLGSNVFGFAINFTGVSPNYGEVEAQVGLSNNTAPYLRPGISLLDSAWHHVVLTCSPSIIRMYVDGAEAATVAGTSRDERDIRPLRVGAAVDGGQGFNGWVDEAAVYETTLSPARVLAHYNAGLGISPVTEAEGSASLVGIAAVSAIASEVPQYAVAGLAGTALLSVDSVVHLPMIVRSLALTVIWE